jgi:hypothetical protein
VGVSLSRKFDVNFREFKIGQPKKSKTLSFFDYRALEVSPWRVRGQECRRDSDFSREGERGEEGRDWEEAATKVYQNVRTK